MNEQSIICISCPIGCELTIRKRTDGELDITGNLCKRGLSYGTQEVIQPMRILTTTVSCLSPSGQSFSLPVRTQDAIPKDSLDEAMDACRALRVRTPIAMGQILIEDLAGSGVPLIASRDYA